MIDTRCPSRGCRRETMVAEETTILRGIERAPVTLTVYRCPRCKRVYTPRAERERLASSSRPGG